jgi:hypothetical protein
MNAQFVETLQQTHLALWNEKDASRREELITSIYADDIKMYDKDFILSGTSEISNFIGKLLTDDSNFHFSAAKPMQATQNGIRFYWNVQNSGSLLTGMDFFIIENEKVTELYVFMDKDA